jgi:hypothetical protein
MGNLYVRIRAGGGGAIPIPTATDIAKPPLEGADGVVVQLRQILSILNHHPVSGL